MTLTDVIKMIGHKPIAFVSSKYKCDIEANVLMAREYTKIAIEKGFIPITPHLYLPDVLDDNDPKQREQALQICLGLVISCDVFMLCGDMPEDSFMVEEHKQALRCGKLIMRVSITHD
jgi:hypothetical protein